MAAFHNDPVEYKTWLKVALQAEVESREVAAVQAAAQAQANTKLTELKGLLDSST
jgi:hypothetical protein